MVLMVFVLLSLTCHLLQPCTPGTFSTGMCCTEAGCQQPAGLLDRHTWFQKVQETNITE